MPNSVQEKLYYKMPVALQNILFSIYGWNLSRKRYNYWFHYHLARLKKMEWWSSQQIEEYQNKNFVDIVGHAYNTVPFYRKWYDESGVDVGKIKSLSDLSKLPILTKQMVKENQNSMVSTVFKRRALIKGLTSGTTGTPLTIFQTKEGLSFQWAIWWRHKARFGLSHKDRHLTFGARVPIEQNQLRPPYWLNDYFNNRVYLSTYHISEQTVKDIVTFLNRSHFDFFTGYPSAMYALASLIDEQGLLLKNSPKYIVSGSDALLPKYEGLIGRVFGAPITEQYGMAEFAGNMSKCEHGIFHEDFECCYIENISKPQRLLLTGWGNYAMPFIRYEVGDLCTVSPTICPCGRMSKGYSSIEGRLEDYVLTPDGRKLIGMNQVFEYAKNAKEIQIYQPSQNKVQFKIVAGNNFGDMDKKALEREFRRRAGIDMKIEFILVKKLQRSSSGKLKAVVSDNPNK
ncbi:MAG: phenylacetate-CoA ligase [Candidatus Magnetoglobus multicellularis str. Araruama]|uniref:Phenylacetate-CoA ligase n=1 Tax=Candidatus Magnetoglobus multicellularis str. Araruama TaxID=890399 RepID=A0A1V1PH92_9BACT|nr:MAG: phenylacetate-CoA ligase [Candidatus Magnetoglobus multicellularis str. Araruama]